MTSELCGSSATRPGHFRECAVRVTAWEVPRLAFRWIYRDRLPVGGLPVVGNHVGVPGMFQIRRIVVGVEMPANRPWDTAKLAAPSRLAVRQAFHLANPGRIPVTLVAVLPPANAGWFGSSEDADRAAAADYVASEAVLKDLRQQYTKVPGSTQTDIAVRTGEAWEELIRSAGNRPDCLLMCGTRDQGSLRRVIFGSTGLKLLRLAPAAVWIVKPRIDDNDSTDIVAATDLGPVGADVLQTAVPLCKALNAKLHVIHVVDHANTLPDAVSNAESMVHQQLAATDHRTLPFGVKVNVVQGRADECILKATQDCCADVVIFGTSSKTGVSGLLPGSTVERLLPELACSVLAMKPEGFRSMLPSDFWTLHRPFQHD